jgi:hypothetical protein
MKHNEDVLAARRIRGAVVEKPPILCGSWPPQNEKAPGGALSADPDTPDATIG